MVWVNQIIFWIPFLLIVAILVSLFREDFLKGEIALLRAKNAVILVTGIFILQVLAKIGVFYYELKKDPLGAYLLPGKGSPYFSQVIWNYIKPVILAFLIAFFLALGATIIKRFSQKPFFDTSDILVIFLTSFVVGFPNIFVLLLGGLFLMVIVQVFRRAGKERLRISPFLLILSIAILVLSNFNFYNRFLNFIGLI